MDGEYTPDNTFEEADPPTGGLRTLPRIRHNPPNKPKNIRKLTNLTASITQNKNTPTKRQLQNVYSGNSYKRQETQDHTSVFKHTPNPHTNPDEPHMKWPKDHMSTYAKKNISQGPMLCTKCNQPLTNIHLLGGCKHNTKLRTSRHNSTLKLLHEDLENTTEGGGQ